MSQKYFTILTNLGAALHANAQLQQSSVPWTHLVLGDGNGVEPVPSPVQTNVVNEVDRIPITSIESDIDNPGWIVITAVIPAERGGYVVRETALMGGRDGNQCIAVGNYPAATKVLPALGAPSELVIRVVVEISSTATVILKIDPAVVIASRDYVDKALKAGFAKFGGEVGNVVFGTAGTHVFEVPEVLKSGVKKAFVTVEGGGGGAGAHSAGGGGGGGGGLALKLLDLVGVQSVNLVVGIGGSGAVAADTAAGKVGGPGGSSSFGAYVSATGGMGGDAWLGGGAGVGVGGDVNSGTGAGGSPLRHDLQLPPNAVYSGGNGGGPNGGRAHPSTSIGRGGDGGMVSGGAGGSAAGVGYPYGAGGNGGCGRVTIRW